VTVVADVFQVLVDDALWALCALHVDAVCCGDLFECAACVAEHFAFAALLHVSDDVGVEAPAQRFGRESFLFERQVIAEEAGSADEFLYVSMELSEAALRLVRANGDEVVLGRVEAQLLRDFQFRALHHCDVFHADDHLGVIPSHLAFFDLLPVGRFDVGVILVLELFSGPLGPHPLAVIYGLVVVVALLLEPDVHAGAELLCHLLLGFECHRESVAHFRVCKYVTYTEKIFLEGIDRLILKPWR